MRIETGRRGVTLEGPDSAKQSMEYVVKTTHDDIWDLMIDIQIWCSIDVLTYGYCPWDYIKEYMINMELQK